MTDLAPITSRDLGPVAHGFFTRQGGVSAGLYDSLNCGVGAQDDPGAVAENRARVTRAMTAEDLCTLHQAHTADVITITAPSGGARPRADAMVTATPGLALGVLTADCAPVLLADPDAGVVGAAHAGWKGALGGVLEATLDAMAALGARNVTAVIGPTISQAAYEVGPEFLDRFVDEDPETARFFAGGAEDRAQFDLPGYALHRLRAAGAEAAWTGHCTYRDAARFFSYRRATHAGEPDYGRQIAAIRL
ncbi:MAG: peptidoglycan editing factor PgeF [Pseudomonadota bacterium]